MWNLPIKERWVSITLGGVPMEKINLPFFYQLGFKLNPLTRFTVDASKRIEIFIAAFAVKDVIRSLLDTFSTLAVCRAAGEALISACEDVHDWVRSTPSEKWEERDYLADGKFKQVINKAKELETVLSNELPMLDTYHVTRKGIYDTTALITRAEDSLPVSVLSKIGNKSVTDIRESGKCLAFDCATASGFHIMRATEAVMQEYYVYVCKPKSKKSLGGWAEYISALYKFSEDTDVKEDVREDAKKVIALLQQIKDQDRNLIMHPEVILTPDDAHTLFEIAKGAIIAMADKLPEGKKKTDKGKTGEGK